jgi:hypothetical protein
LLCFVEADRAFGISAAGESNGQDGIYVALRLWRKNAFSVLLHGSRTRPIEVAYPNRAIYILSVSPDVHQVQIPLNMI